MNPKQSYVGVGAGLDPNPLYYGKPITDSASKSVIMPKWVWEICRIMGAGNSGAGVREGLKSVAFRATGYLQQAFSLFSCSTAHELKGKLSAVINVPEEQADLIIAEIASGASEITYNKEKQRYVRTLHLVSIDVTTKSNRQRLVERKRKTNYSAKEGRFMKESSLNYPEIWGIQLRSEIPVAAAIRVLKERIGVAPCSLRTIQEGSFFSCLDPQAEDSDAFPSSVQRYQREVRTYPHLLDHILYCVIKVTLRDQDMQEVYQSFSDRHESYYSWEMMESYKDSSGELLVPSGGSSLQG